MADVCASAWLLYTNATMVEKGWCGQIHPNKTQPWDSFNDVTTACAKTESKTGCLFDVLADPGEHVDLALSTCQTPGTHFVGPSLT